MAEQQAERVGLAGRVGSDIKPGWTKDGKHKTASFRFAVDQGEVNGEGVWEKTGTEWFTVWTRDKLAEQVYKNFRKGQEVLVLGYVRHSTYEAQDGSERPQADISAAHVGPSIRNVDVQIHRINPLDLEAAVER